jgi:predicted LPLAT superfamily acyltransferase
LDRRTGIKKLKRKKKDNQKQVMMVLENKDPEFKKEILDLSQGSEIKEIECDPRLESSQDVRE